MQSMSTEEMDGEGQLYLHGVLPNRVGARLNTEADGLTF